MDESQKQLQDQVQRIADEITQPNNWRKEYRKDNAKHLKEEWGHLPKVEEIGAGEWLEDILDVEYIIDSNRQYKSARIMVAMGGPTIWVNLNTGQVEGYWGGDTVTANFIDNLGLDEYLEDRWGIQ